MLNFGIVVPRGLLLALVAATLAANNAQPWINHDKAPASIE